MEEGRVGRKVGQLHVKGLAVRRSRRCRRSPGVWSAENRREGWSGASHVGLWSQDRVRKEGERQQVTLSGLCF